MRLYDVRCEVAVSQDEGVGQMAEIRASEVELLRLTGNDKSDRRARRLTVALGGAIVGSCVLRILGSFIGYDTLIVELAGALIGFVVVYPNADGNLPGDL
jgi:hypothetical protein